MFDLNIEQELIDRFKRMSHPELANHFSIALNLNKGSFNSIVLASPKTPYRDSIQNALLARIKTGGKKTYISFEVKYKQAFEDAGFETYSIKSDQDFFRIELNHFYYSIDNVKLTPIIQQIIEDLFINTPFGCCDKYINCSDEKKCIHEDPVYAMACYYRKNLLSGKIFYGKNRNV